MLEGCGGNGNRTATLPIRQKSGLMVTRDAVARAQIKLDPLGVATRRKRKLKRRLYTADGVNAVWHYDGYHQIARYIHGCVDGFSRKIVWLHVAS